MTEQSMPTAGRRRRGGWLKKIVLLTGLLLVLLITGWFVVTSPAFLKGVILPRAGRAMNASITVVDARIQPFSAVALHGLKVAPLTGEPEVFSAREVLLEYNLRSILRGRLAVGLIAVDAPVVTVVEQADGRRNIDALLPAEGPPKARQPAAEPLQIDLRRLIVEGGELRYWRERGDGTRDRLEVNALKVQLDDLRNGGAGRLAIDFRLAGAWNPPETEQRGTLQAEHRGQYTFSLGPDLLPTRIAGADRFRVLEATGMWTGYLALAADLDVDVTPEEVKGITLAVRQAGESLGELRVNGPLDLTKREGRLEVALGGVDRRLLNLIGSPLGFDFNETSVTSTNRVELSRGGEVIRLRGQTAIHRLQATQNQQTTPRLDLNSDYDVTARLAEGRATLDTLSLAGLQDGRPLIRTDLSRAMTFAWGGEAPEVGDSVLVVAIEGLQPADWRAFLGDELTGEVRATLRLDSQRAGRLLAFTLDGQWTGYDSGFDQVPVLNLAFRGAGQLTDFDRFEAREYRLEAAAPDGLLLTVLGTAGYDVTKNQADAAATLSIPRTARETGNAVGVVARLDLAQAEAMTGRVTVTGSTLDITDVYDRYQRGFVPPSDPPPAPATVEEEEPEAFTLPLRDFITDVRLDRLLLKELVLTNVHTTITLDGGKMRIDPIAAHLNGAPVNGLVDFDFAVPGWRYEVALKADTVPLPPLVDSFVPEYAGATRGEVHADLQIAGVGFTGPNLRQHLAGHAGLSLTNASVQLLRNPQSPLGRTLKSVVQVLGTALRLPALSESPVTHLALNSTLGAGEVNLQNFHLAASAFRVRSHGTISLAEVMTNSLYGNLPIEFALNRGLAEKARLAAVGKPDGDYVDFGRLASLAGTIGDPKTQVDGVRLTTITAQGLANLPGVTGTEAGNLIQGLTEGVGGLLTGERTNVVDVLQGLGGLLGERPRPAAPSPQPAQPTTNAPPPEPPTPTPPAATPTNPPPATPATPPLTIEAVPDLLRELRGLTRGGRPSQQTPTNPPPAAPKPD